MGFNKGTTSYSQTVAAGTVSLDLTATLSDPQALMFVNGSPLASGAPKTVNLAYGSSRIEVMVVVRDATVKTYTINISRGFPAITWSAGSLTAANIDASGLTLNWPAASCDAGISGYEIYQGSVLLSSVSSSVYSYNAAGLAAGTEYTFSVKAANTSGNQSGPLSVTASTTALASSLSINSGSISAATVGVPYIAALTAGGGTAPYTWSVTGLPAGLSLNNSTGEITGTPSAAGFSVVNATVTDSAGTTTSKGLTLAVNYPAGTGKYTITPVSDTAYSAGATPDGIAALTVNSGITGFKYFTVNVGVSESHPGDEAAVFVQMRNGAQLAINATAADFDQVAKAKAAFNVQPGDVIKVYVVDDLTNAKGFNPVLLQ
ncbi:MAG: putative Ig domain-containing protein [Syntrophomonas sp.]